MKRKIERTDFRVLKVSFGEWKVTYTSPVTGKEWTCKTNDAELIDATWHEDEPKRKDLEILKSKCKRG